MDWSVAKIGTIYQKPAQAIGLSTPPIGCVLGLPGLPGGGNKIYDRSPYGNHGTITGAVWKRLPSGLWILDFDGTDDYVEIVDPPSGSLDFGTGDFTLGAWIKTSSVAGYILMKTVQASWSTGYILTLDGAGHGRLYVNADGDNGAILINDNKWHHLLATRSGTVGNLYVDGQLDASPFVTSGTTVNTTENFYIGRKHDLSATGFFHGLIGLPRIHNRALSALEIQNHFNREKHLFGVW